jgi:hypothetical protein
MTGKADTGKAVAGAKVEMLDLGDHYQTAEEIAEGKWYTLDCKLETRIARTNSPQFYKAATVMRRKYGGRGDREMPADKAIKATIGTLARAIFLEFKGKVRCDGEVLSDSFESREKILDIYPDIREEISRIAGAAAEEYQLELEQAGKD